MTTTTNTACRDEAATYLGKAGPPIFGRAAVDASAIRGFLGAVEDANPLYWDDEAAARSRFGAPIAPPQLTMTMGKSLFWTPSDVLARERAAAGARGGDPLARVYEVVRKHGYIYDINVSHEDEYLELYRPGEGRISEQTRVTDVSAERETRLGRAVFVTTSMEYRTERGGKLVARATNVMMSYRPHGLPDDAEPEGAPPPLRAAAAPAANRAWESVSESEELPVATYGPLTSATVAKAMADTHDFSRLMFDQEFARQRGLRGAVVNTMWYQGLLGRYATEWGGPESLLTRLGFRMRGSNCAGDTLTVRGRVTRRYVEGGRKLVDVEVQVDNQFETGTVSGTLTLELT